MTVLSIKKEWVTLEGVDLTYFIEYVFIFLTHENFHFFIHFFQIHLRKGWFIELILEIVGVGMENIFLEHRFRLISIFVMVCAKWHCTIHTIIFKIVIFLSTTLRLIIRVNFYWINLNFWLSIIILQIFKFF